MPDGKVGVFDTLLLHIGSMCGIDATPNYRFLSGQFVGGGRSHFSSLHSGVLIKQIHMTCIDSEI